MRLRRCLVSRGWKVCTLRNKTILTLVLLVFILLMLAACVPPITYHITCYDKGEVILEIRRASFRFNNHIIDLDTGAEYYHLRDLNCLYRKNRGR